MTTEKVNHWLRIQGQSDTKGVFLMYEQCFKAGLCKNPPI